MGKLSENFTTAEFACPCCGQCNMDQDFMEKLQELRMLLGVPFRPVEGGGYRCEIYNGSKTGAHTEGKACDPDFSYVHYYDAIKIAMGLGFTGIGVKNIGSGDDKRFQLHLDTAGPIEGKRARPAFWTY